MELVICCKGAIRFLQFHILFFSCFCLLKFSSARDTITLAQPIADPESIISGSGAFELGFFSPANTTNRFVGIWYRNIPVKTLVWVANRNRPLVDSSGTFSVSKDDGNLVVLNGRKEMIWSSNASISASSSSSARLLDYGTLVLLDNSSGKTIWESFDHLSDSYLRKMKLKSNANTGEKTIMNSWKSPFDPSVGSFYMWMNPSPIPEVFVWKDGLPYWRTGPWNGRVFIGIEHMNSMYLNGFNRGDDGEGTVYLTFTYADRSSPTYFFLNHEGRLIQRHWIQSKQEWEVDWSAPATDCEVYGKCGPFGSCNSRDSPICSCLKGFEPKHVEEWKSGNFTGGCVRRTKLSCSKDGFFKVAKVKVPAFTEWSPALQDQCEGECLKNCSCTAYAYNSGTSCMLWSGSLFDIQVFSRDGTDLYIRVDRSELDKKDMKVVVILLITGSIVFVICIGLLCARKIKQKGKKHADNKLLLNRSTTSLEHSSEILLNDSVNQVKLEELPLFKFKELTIATNNFDITNKLGQGGFGPVYRIHKNRIS